MLFSLYTTIVAVNFGDLFDEIWDAPSFKTVYHKGNLAGGKVSPGRSLSTGEVLDDVSALERSGKVHQFDIPSDVFNKWERQGFIDYLEDYDVTTGVRNSEVRFSGQITEELNKYIKQ